ERGLRTGTNVAALFAVRDDAGRTPAVDETVRVTVFGGTVFGEPPLAVGANAVTGSRRAACADFGDAGAGAAAVDVGGAIAMDGDGAARGALRGAAADTGGGAGAGGGPGWARGGGRGAGGESAGGGGRAGGGVCL